MGLIGPERTTVEICPLCELDARDGRHATSRHQNEPTVEVEYVRADLLRGAVSKNEQLKRDLHDALSLALTDDPDWTDEHRETLARLLKLGDD